MNYCTGHTLEPQKANSDTTNIKVCKLHGSLNWVEKDGKIDIGFDPAAALLAQCKPNAATPTTGKLDCDLALQGSSGGPRRTPLIVPPSDGKHQFRNMMASIWQDAFDLLRRAEHVFVIGYSIPQSDQFFRNFYALSMLSPTILQRVWIIDKAGGQVFDRFRSLLGPAAHKPGVYSQLAHTFSQGLQALKTEIAAKKDAF